MSGSAGTPSTGLETRNLLSTAVTRLPALVRGELVVPPWPTVGDLTALRRSGPPGVGPPRRSADGSAYLLARPLVDRETLEPIDELELLVLPAVDPRRLLEPAPHAAVRALLDLTGDDVADVVAAVGGAMSDADGLASLLGRGSLLGDRAHRGFAAQVPGLFDPAAVRTAMHAAYGDAVGWASVEQPTVLGPLARMAGAPARSRRPQRRPVPTRQLHITAGNAPVVPLASLLWGWCSRGACVVKVSGRACLVPALVAQELSGLPPHPLIRHTSVVYWPGGEREIEDVVLAAGAFERRLVWGSEATVASVTERDPGTDTIAMRPRHSLSVIGAAALDDLATTVAAAAVDSLVENQAACMSSLLHVVIGTAQDADRYAEALRAELAAWDVRLPHRASRQTAGRIVGLRRGELAAGRWLINGELPALRSAVVRHDGYLDLSRHPGGRLVVVTALDDAARLLPRLGPEVSTVGVAPEALRIELRDDLVAAGVDNVLPLGRCDEGYPDRPHDGVQVLRRLVRWVNA